MLTTTGVGNVIALTYKDLISRFRADQGVGVGGSRDVTSGDGAFWTLGSNIDPDTGDFALVFMVRGNGATPVGAVISTGGESNSNPGFCAYFSGGNLTVHPADYES